MLVGELGWADAWKLPFWLLGLNFIAPTLFTPLPAVAPQWWYIGLAVQIYATFPLIQKLRLKFGLVALVAAAAVVNTASVIVIQELPAKWVYLHMVFVGARCLEVVTGVVLYDTIRADRPLRARLPVWGLLVLAFWTLAVAQPFATARWILEPALVGVVALALLLPCGGLRSRVRLRKLVVWAGSVSYPLYLCHFAIIALLVAFLDRVHALSAGTLSILAFPLCILVAEGFRRSLPWALRVSKRGARTATDAGGQRPED